MNILLVCTGNTCRSPMAEGILKRLLPQHNVSSAGICTEEGLAASSNAMIAASEIGIDISAHKSRQITKEIAETSDLILCMTNNHKKLMNDVNQNTFTLGEFAGINQEVLDPYGGTIEKYRICRDQLKNMLAIAAEKINDRDKEI